MVRTQVQLTDDQMRTLKRMAAERGISVWICWSGMQGSATTRSSAGAHWQPRADSDPALAIWRPSMIDTLPRQPASERFPGHLGFARRPGCRRPRTRQGEKGLDGPCRSNREHRFDELRGRGSGLRFAICAPALLAMLLPSHGRPSSPAPSYNGPRLTGPDEVMLTLYSAVLALSEL